MGIDAANDSASLRSTRPVPLVPLLGWILLVVASVIMVAAFVVVIIWGPGFLVVQGKAGDDAYLQAIASTRTALVQAVVGFAVFLGGIVGLFTLRHNREQLRIGREEHQDSLAASRQALEQTLDVTRVGQITD